jgi:hypothetical protein
MTLSKLNHAGGCVRKSTTAGLAHALGFLVDQQKSCTPKENELNSFEQNDLRYCISKLSLYNCWILI